MPPSPSAGDRSSPDRSPDDRSPEDLSSGNRSTDGEFPGDRSADGRSADDRFADDRPMAASLLAAGRVLRDRPGAILLDLDARVVEIGSIGRVEPDHPDVLADGLAREVAADLAQSNDGEFVVFT